MNLDDLKRDIRYSLGDIKEEKFDAPRLLLALRKVMNAINKDFHLYKTRTYLKVSAHKRTYFLPSDFYFLSALNYNNYKLGIIFKNDKKLNINEESDNSIQYVVADNNTYSEIDLQPIVTAPNLTIHIIDSLGSTAFDISKIVDVRYEGNEAYVYYDKVGETVTATIEADYGLLTIDYIGELERDLSAPQIDFPFSFYDVIHFKVVSDLLSDDSREEVIVKSERYLLKYEKALKNMQSDGRYKYVFSDLLTDYSGGIV